MSNLRNQRTKAYNKIIDDLWNEKLKKYQDKKLLKKIDLTKIDTIDFNNYFRNHSNNYANQICNLYYFNRINGIILSDDDDDNKLIDQIEVFNILKKLQETKKSFYSKHIRRYMAVYKIQQWWKPIFYNPRNNLMETMIDNHFNEYESSLKKIKLEVV